MTEETPINYNLVETPLTDDGGYMWFLMLVIIIICLGLLGVYYYTLYFYDSLTLEDAIEKAIKHFNQSNSDTGNTGNTGIYDHTEEEEEALEKVLDDATTEGFSNYTPVSSDTQNLGQLNWCFIDENSTECNATTCMSGDIFPSRDVCINPKLRML
jgi:Flp pilus assembly protein TadG